MSQITLECLEHLLLQLRLDVKQDFEEWLNKLEGGKMRNNWRTRKKSEWNSGTNKGPRRQNKISQKGKAKRNIIVQGVQETEQSKVIEILKQKMQITLGMSKETFKPGQYKYNYYKEKEWNPSIKKSLKIT